MKRKQNWIWVLIVFLLIAIALMLIPRKAGASDGYPKGVQVFQVDGHTCVLYVGSGKAGLECFCPCEDDCNVVTYIDEPTPTPTDKPKKTPKKTPTTPPSTATPKPECKIWLCHKPGTPAEQNYCCYDSEGCKSAHLNHGDYLGKCK